MLTKLAFNQRIFHQVAASVLGTAALWVSTGISGVAAPRLLSQGGQDLEMQGVSGGPSLISDCAASLPTEASEEIELSEAFIQQSGFLKFVLEAEGSPVLLLDGPAGRFCSLGDNETETQPEISGYWLPGLYKVYVGDRNSTPHPYKLSVVEAEN